VTKRPTGVSARHLFLLLGDPVLRFGIESTSRTVKTITDNIINLIVL